MFKIDFIPFLINTDMKIVEKWFDSDTFFYDSHLPSKIPFSEIERLVTFPNSHTTVITCNGMKVGLCDYIMEERTRIAKIEFCLASDDLYTTIGREVLTAYITRLFNSIPAIKVMKYVYEFDHFGHTLFETYPFYKEGTLYSMAFKDNRYWDVLVYSLLDEELKGVKEVHTVDRTT
ncbi:hypothetical protein SY88_22595 [Clostridiales bacterium PH28_bin88]|nr:hypothetical protein SY88_22595 [Clostridiales bacterium PH28_bin88]